MCLDYDLKPKQAAKIKAEAQRRGYIRVWKVCRTNPYNSTGVFSHLSSAGNLGQARYKEGLRKACGDNTDKNVGWYAFLGRRTAENYKIKTNKEEIKVCYAKPSWIKRLGGYESCGEAAIFTHLCFPDWKTGDMTIREFRAMCKGKP